MRISPRLLTPATDWVIFLITVAVSIALLFMGNNAAVSVFKGEVGDLLAYLATPTKYVRQGIDLWRENETLRNYAMNLTRENDELRDAAFENERLRSMLDFKERFPMLLKAAEVIAYSGAHIGGQIRINAGLSDGVVVNAVVLTPQGLVGKVIETGDHSSVVQTLVGNTYGVSVMIERSRQMGILRWQATGEWKIIGLPTGADARIGDLVLTTGAGAVFPKGIRVGVVSATRLGNNSLGKDYLVSPFVDFQAIEDVFFVTATEPRDGSFGSRTMP
jgi:rod shape-determining protein MreC